MSAVVEIKTIRAKLLMRAPLLDLLRSRAAVQDTADLWSRWPAQTP